jgi:hypothetical protein
MASGAKHRFVESELWIGGADDVCGEALDPETSAPRLKDTTSGELGEFHVDQFTILDVTLCFSRFVQKGHQVYMRLTNVSQHGGPFSYFPSHSDILHFLVHLGPALLTQTVSRLFILVPATSMKPINDTSDQTTRGL